MSSKLLSKETRPVYTEYHEDIDHHRFACFALASVVIGGGGGAIGILETHNACFEVFGHSFKHCLECSIFSIENKTNRRKRKN